MGQQDILTLFANIISNDCHPGCSGGRDPRSMSGRQRLCSVGSLLQPTRLLQVTRIILFGNVYLSFVFRFRWFCSWSTFKVQLFHNSFATKPLSANSMAMHGIALYNSSKNKGLEELWVLIIVFNNCKRIHCTIMTAQLIHLANPPILSICAAPGRNFWVAGSSGFFLETWFLEMQYCFYKEAGCNLLFSQRGGTSKAGEWDGSFGSPTNPKPGGPQSDWIKKNAKSGAARNEEYYGKVVWSRLPREKTFSFFVSR